MPITDAQTLSENHLAIIALLAGRGSLGSSSVSSIIDISETQTKQLLDDLVSLGVIYQLDQKYALRKTPSDTLVTEGEFHVSLRDYITWGLNLLLYQVSIDKLSKMLSEELQTTLARLGKAYLYGWASFRIEVLQGELFSKLQYFRSLSFYRLITLLAKIDPYRQLFFASHSEKFPLSKKQIINHDLVGIALKSWIGLLALRGSTPISIALQDLSQILQFVTHSKVSQHLNPKDCITLLALLSLTDDWNISLEFDEVIVELPVQNPSPEAINEVFEKARHNGIVEVLPGLVEYLDRNKEISLRKLRQDVIQIVDSNQHKDGAEKLFLGALAISHILTGIITEDDLLIVNQVWKNSWSLFPILSIEEVAVLGGVLSLEDPSVKSIAEILNINKSKIERLLDSLSTKLNLEFVISPAQSIKLISEPRIPILSTRLGLSRNELLILGYLITHSSASLEELSHFFGDLPSNTKLQALGLIGKGIIDAQISDHTIYLERVLTDESSQHLLVRLIPREKQLLGAISVRSPPIDLRALSNQFNMPFFIVRETMYLLTGLGLILEPMLDGAILSKFSLAEHISISLDQCITCGRKTDVSSLYCKTCFEKLSICGICKSPIHASYEASKCNACRTLYHKPHLDQWLEINPNCPICKQSIASSQTQRREENE